MSLPNALTICPHCQGDFKAAFCYTQRQKTYILPSKILKFFFFYSELQNLGCAAKLECSKMQLLQKKTPNLNNREIFMPQNLNSVK